MIQFDTQINLEANLIHIPYFINGTLFVAKGYYIYNYNVED